MKVDLGLEYQLELPQVALRYMLKLGIGGFKATVDKAKINYQLGGLSQDKV